ncbi:glutamate racemase [Blochmannia endosymbiont of Camponotus (Colobopsis) obliquus]|uniref:glutamate racemase n=1 Tax=Blochmannia endosymbiont of Camponotus (Colobopsis) obliquus TaxID=1505597 RepID=UPI00061A71DF|nr:glutamate racemase [Blochmannia endosymbiont of Camponotus (Colobopsis) obliquus]AKC60734.1 glutamate racemase [Blochmannia endosymbiont of Camponotus (Colobopsis) obliquus]
MYNCSVKQPVILVIDSGIGGLSIYLEIRNMLPHVRYLYFFDNKGFPYGERSEQFIVDRMIAIISAILKHHVLDLIIVACNTASIVALSMLRKVFLCRIIGVFPAVKLAVQLTRNKIIGLLGTCITVKHKYILALVNKYARDCNFLFLGSSSLVTIAERKKFGDIVSRSFLRSILIPWLELFNPPDTVILGCTHFLFLKDELQELFPNGTQLIDSSRYIASYVAKLMHDIIDTKYCGIIQKNVMYCSVMTDEMLKSMSFINSYGFSSLEVIFM